MDINDLVQYLGLSKEPTSPQGKKKQTLWSDIYNSYRRAKRGNISARESAYSKDTVSPNTKKIEELNKKIDELVKELRELKKKRT